MKSNTDRAAGRQLLLGAAYGLTSSLLGTAAHAEKRESGKVVDHEAGYKARIALPLIGHRHVPASSRAIRTSDHAMLPSPRSASITTPAPHGLFRGDATKLPTNSPSKEIPL